MERTGHRSIEGIRSYKRTSSEQQEAVSDILSSSKRPYTAALQQMPQPQLPSRVLSVASSSQVNINTILQRHLQQTLVPFVSVPVQTLPLTSADCNVNSVLYTLALY